ncbi:ABC transporter ATP-binding protein [Acetanaerobacterium elongatum]|uniref:Fluoroquinolone transport system ATP-binding protein n=1 Tax=Acetanaerobacterium elongatum TaxID=258515 RepID=A0A1G9XGS6_9FIRM|nr:ABC transporter ATP-binding protein [Acetanaerobacterium elongatum]SDM95646.1 fluoroquinolone transport system ATP-binding protein [Acetanaerobacterium elongatum]
MLTAENLEYTYAGSKAPALKKISFAIEKGEIFGFLGPSGSGKTTTQRTIIGLLRGYKGSVRVFGRERSEYGREFFERIGVAFDFPNLYNKLTAAENLKLLGGYYQNTAKDTDALLERVGLLSDRDKRVEGFSKGMKMRLNFVRSIMHNPDFLFFDEPTSGLDPVNARIIKDIILQLKNEGKTVFLTTHNMTVAEELCDRVAFLCDGQITLCDTPANLKVNFGRRMVKVAYRDGDGVVCEEFSLDTLGREKRLYELLQTREIQTIHSEDASLEEIFIKVTGRMLE